MHIKIDLKIALFLLIFIITKQIEFYILCMIFAIIHELGHLFIGILFGFKPKGISLIPMGLSINFFVNCNEYSKKIKNINVISIKKLLISMAGPITNFLISIIFIFCDISMFEHFREKIIYINLIIGFFNLIPIYPLDGGRIVKNILHIKINKIASYKYTNIIIAILFIILYLWIIVIRENNVYRKKMHLYNLTGFYLKNY